MFELCERSDGVSGQGVRSDGAALVFLERVVVEGVVVVPVVLVVELVVVLRVSVEVDVGERARALAEQPVVEALLQFPRFAEPASSSFSRHVVTCLARQRTGTVCCRNRSPRRLAVLGATSYRKGRFP